MISSSAARPPVAAYVSILLSEVEHEQRPSGNGDREAIVVGVGLCDGEGEQKPDTRHFAERQFDEREGQSAENDSAICP